MLWQHVKRNGRTPLRLSVRFCQRLLERLRELISDGMLTAIACSMITIGFSLLIIGFSLLRISTKEATFVP